MVDINLCGDMAYSGADALIEQGVPFVLATGYSAAALLACYAAVPRCDKPIDAGALVAALFPN